MVSLDELSGGSRSLNNNIATTTDKELCPLDLAGLEDDDITATLMGIDPCQDSEREERQRCLVKMPCLALSRSGMLKFIVNDYFIYIHIP